jgi:large subunit ribosomal protein L15
MRLTEVAPQLGSTRRRRRLGRGVSAGQGASCGKGMRGQKARKGGSTRPGFEGGQNPLYRRVPKLKGFPLINPKEFTVVNVGSLRDLPAGTVVDLASLMAAGIVTSDDGPLKLLGRGELGVALTVRAAACSAGARAKVEAAGGCVELI